MEETCLLLEGSFLINYGFTAWWIHSRSNLVTNLIPEMFKSLNLILVNSL